MEDLSTIASNKKARREAMGGFVDKRMSCRGKGWGGRVSQESIILKRNFRFDMRSCSYGGGFAASQDSAAHRLNKGTC